MSITTPTPADLMIRRPAGAPGGGQFLVKANTAPERGLHEPVPATVAGASSEDEELEVPSLAKPVFEEAQERAAELDTEYRDLWKRVNAKHRGSVYGDARRLSATSDDPAELAIMSHLAYDGIAENVARNPHTPAAVLHQLAIGESDHREDRVRHLAVMHPNCDEATIRIVWAHRDSSDFTGRAAGAVAGAPNTPADIRADAALGR